MLIQEKILPSASNNPLLLSFESFGNITRY